LVETDLIQFSTDYSKSSKLAYNHLCGSVIIAATLNTWNSRGLGWLWTMYH